MLATRAIAASVVFAAAVAALLLVVWALQRKLIYFPSGVAPSPAAVGLPSAVPVTFPTEDGLMLNGWFVRPASTPWFTVIVFNGNAGSRAMRASLADAFVRGGIAIVLFDYRGYGGNSGVPSEGGLTVDARAVRRYIVGRADVDPARVAYFGESLGSAVAVTLAAEFPPAAMVLRSPFASLAEVAAFHYPFLPVRWLLRDRYASIEVIARIPTPLLVIAGESDRIIPLAHSRRLFDAASQPKMLRVIKGADHNDAALNDGPEMMQVVIEFLRRVRG